MFLSLFHFIGNNMPFIIFLLSLFLLRSFSTVSLFYIIGSIVSTIINSCLKILIRQPRPALSYEYQHSYLQKYGMPSGHSQFCGFSFMYISLHQKSYFITFIYALLSLITAFQRYLSHNHTIIQIIIGFVLGCFIGYSFHELVVKKIMNKEIIFNNIINK
jgi:membrane-associated phospholipid phosphatase